MKEDSVYKPLFETKRAKERFIYKLLAVSVFVSSCLIWVYRVNHIPSVSEDGIGRWAWIGLFAAEVWFGVYWIFTQSLRWNIVHRFTFKDRLSQRYENELPGVDVFVCTADPAVEPPMMVINTVLSVMAYDFPTEKLSVYLSDDAGSDLTFYALLEASHFAKHWLPYCKKFVIQPRSPAAYFSSISISTDGNHDEQLETIRSVYEDMESRIEAASNLGRFPEGTRSKHPGFSRWDSYTSRLDHDAILEVLIDGKDPNAVDAEGSPLPTLVYLAREKRPEHFHNFKAGAMNALIRVSEKLSNGEIILNVDCDMYSNDSNSIRDALCFLMDEKKGPEIAFVQFPQTFSNLTKNDIYSGSLRVISNVEFHGMDGDGGPMYIGTGCFHRRDTLSGRRFAKGKDNQLKIENSTKGEREESINDMRELARGLACCAVEKNSQWGKEVGLVYGCPVEDVITGLAIQCRGWKSVYFNPKRTAFMGVAPVTLPQTLVQHKRWSEGDLQVLLSKLSPAWYAHGKISIGQRLGYCCFGLWALNSLPTLYYSLVPSICFLKGIPLFPKLSSPWFMPFAYVIFAKYTCSCVEFLSSGGTFLGWWNDQRMWLYKRNSSFLYALIETILKSFGFSPNTVFVLTSKVSTEEVSERYEKEIMEFGASSPMSTSLVTVALVNLVCLVGGMVKTVFGVSETMTLQILLCCVLVLINMPLYNGIFLRRDKGKMPGAVTMKSLLLVLSVGTVYGLVF